MQILDMQEPYVSYFQVIDVEPYGLSARHGLTAKAQTKEGTNLCNWFLTEINSRPVNLYYKGDEVGTVMCTSIYLVCYCISMNV